MRPINLRSANSQNCLDIVATQGAYLVTRANTPVFETTHDEEFAAKLSWTLNGAVIGQMARRIKYREAADEWPIGRTPPEVKEKRKAELKAQEELEGVTSDDSSDNDNDGDGADGKVGPKKGVAAPNRPRRPHQAPWLPTPPPSADDPLPKSGTDEEDDEGKERPTKTRVSSTTTRVGFTENALPNGSQGKGRKRWRISGPDGEDDDEKEHPTKTHISSTTSVGPAKNAPPDGSQGKRRKRRRTHDVDDGEEETRVTATRGSTRLHPGRARRSGAD